MEYKDLKDAQKSGEQRDEVLDFARKRRHEIIEEMWAKEHPL